MAVGAFTAAFGGGELIRRGGGERVGGGGGGDLGGTRDRSGCTTVTGRGDDVAGATAGEAAFQ